MFGVVWRYALVGTLLAIFASQATGQDKPGEPSPNKPQTSTVLSKGEQSDPDTDISENTRDGLRFRTVARRDSGDPSGWQIYGLSWPEATTGQLPVALIISSRPEAKVIDTDLWSKESGRKDNGMSGHSDDFARRGYLAVWIMLTHQMSDLEFSSCQPEAIATAIEQGVEKIQRLLNALRKEPEADLKHIVIIANGATAVTALVLATRHVDGLKGVINVSGGLSLPDCDARATNDVIGKILATGGANRSTPSLWLYADNDEAFDQMTVGDWRDAYMKVAGDVDLAFIGMDHKPGYLLNFLPASFLRMAPRINGFLDHLGLPAVHESDVDKLVTKLGDEKFRDLAREYLAGPGHKALAVSQSGKWVGTDFSETNDIGAINFTLRDCNQRSGEGCHILMLNNDYQR